MAEGRLNWVAGIDTSQLQRDAQKCKESLHSIGRTAEQEGNKIDSTFKKIRATIAGAFTVQQLTSFAQQIVKVRGEIQSLEVSFTTLLGSKSKASALFGELREFATKTPLMLNDLSKAAQILLSFNVDAEKVMPTLRAIGDISMGDSQKLQSLTLAFAQMSSTGKLMGQDLLQMINAGFNPLAVISEKTGKSISTLKDEMSKGAISADMVAQAFMSAASEGGKYFGMLEAQSQTVQGSISNLEGAWEDMLNAIGEESEGIINGTISALTELVQNYEAVVKVIAELIATYGVYKTAVITLTTIEKLRYQATLAQMAGYTKMGAIIDILKAKQEALNVVMAKNPYALAAVAIATLTYGIYKLATAESETEKELKEVNERLKEQEKELKEVSKQGDVMTDMQKDVVKSTAEETTKIERLSEIIHNNAISIEGRKQAIAELQSIIPNYHAELDAEGNLHNENTKAVNEYINSLNRLAMAQAIVSKKEEINKGIIEARMSMDTSTIDRNGAVANVQSKKQELASAQNRAKENTTTFSTSTGVYYTSMSTKAEEDAVALAEAQVKEIDNNIEIQKKKIVEFKRQNEKLDEISKEYQEELESLNKSTQTSTSGSVSNTKKAQKQKNEEAQRLYDIEENKNKIISAEKQAEFEIQQAKIDAQEEGYQKQIQQNQLNYEKRKEAIAQQEAEMVKQLREKMALEYQQENPTATDTQVIAFKSGITADNLSNTQKSQIEEFYRLNNENLQAENQKALAAMLANYMTYTQKIEAIDEDYARKRADMFVDGDESKGLREGVTQGNVENLDRKRAEATEAITLEFASREEEFNVWCDQISSLSLEKLQELLKQAQEQLAKTEKSGDKNSKSYIKQKSQVLTLEKSINRETAKQNVGVGKRSIKEWEDLYKTLGDCFTQFQELGDGIEGVAGDVIQTAGAIGTSATSMVSSIVQVATGSFSAIQGASTAAATAIRTVETASVILTIISTAMQIAMTIINMFNSDEAKQEQIEALQERIDELQWYLDNIDLSRLQESQGKAIDRINEAYQKQIEEMDLISKQVQNLFGFFDELSLKASRNAELMAGSVQKIADAYANVAYTADKALGEAKYDDARKQLENIAEQQMLIREQIELEKSKKSTDDSQITEWEQKIEELAEDAVTVINEIVEDIIGGTATDMAEQLSDAFFEAFQDGEDYAEAWGEKVDDIVADVIKRMLISKYLEEPMGEIFDKYKEKWYKDGNFQGIDAVMSSMGEFGDELRALVEVFKSGWDEMPDSMKDLFTTETDERTASQKGIASASQESVDELNGRMTAVQGHTYSIAENTKLLLANTSAILQSVLNIETNTDRLETMETSIKDVKTTLNNLAVNGIKIK